MFGLLLTLLILDGILMVVVILLQAGKGGGLAAMGGGAGTGTDNFLGGRQAATVLTKATWTTGAIFIGLSVVLSIISSRSQDAAPLLQDEFRQESVSPQPILPGGEGEGAAPEAGEVVPGPEPGAGETGEPGDDQ